MTILEGFSVEEYKINNSEYYNGIATITPKFNLNQRAIPYLQEIRPNGFLSFTAAETAGAMMEGMVVGYFDNREPYLLSNLVVNGSIVYTSQSSIITNQDNISLNVKANDDENNTDNINLTLNRYGLKYLEDFLCKFTELKETLNDIIDIISSVNNAIPTNSPAVISSAITAVQNKIETIKTNF